MINTLNQPISSLLGNVFVACVDLEATCDDKPEFDRSSMEIIEFGCTLLNPAYEVVGTMNSFVRPVINPTLTQFCKDLTTITQEDVDGADTWADVAVKIRAYFKEAIPDGATVIWMSWGDYDDNQIRKDNVRHNISSPMPMRHFNLKKLEASHRNSKKQNGLGGTLRHMGMTFPGTQHRAGDDALAVAMILQKLGAGLVRSKL